MIEVHFQSYKKIHVFFKDFNYDFFPVKSPCFVQIMIPKHISNQDKDVGLFYTILTIQKSKFTQTYDAFKKALPKNHH